MAEHHGADQATDVLSMAMRPPPTWSTYDHPLLPGIGTVWAVENEVLIVDGLCPLHTAYIRCEVRGADSPPTSCTQNNCLGIVIAQRAPLYGRSDTTRQ